jgi:tryptophan 2,3-dioxygenase
MSEQDPLWSRIHKLEEKFRYSGQDLLDYLDGLLYQRYLTYWDYIHLDTLLSLQTPRTHLPDEEIFIVYHQITELYFKLILHELKQLTERPFGEGTRVKERIDRLNAYYKALISSFSIMVRGMDKSEFLSYRMALLPASGFQSVQYRMIELYSTSLENLLRPGREEKEHPTIESLDEMLEQLYWKSGATDKKSGEKTLTLKQFEHRYNPRLKRIAGELRGKTLYDRYLESDEKIRKDESLQRSLQLMDYRANVEWPLMHLGSANRYLDRSEGAASSTGGTNWKTYLPPQFQRIIFFPTLHARESLEEWGKLKDMEDSGGN